MVEIVRILSKLLVGFTIGDWTRVRAVAGLEILTRASYFLLIFVPILAALWPAVRTGINRYNRAVTDSVDALEAASDQFQVIVRNSSVDKDVSDRLLTVVGSLNNKIDLIMSDFSPMTLEQSNLPTVWVLGFFASLFVMLAHLIYQSAAPSMIKDSSSKEYSHLEVKRYDELDLPGQLARAEEILKEFELEYNLIFEGGSFKPFQYEFEENKFFVDYEKVKQQLKDRQDLLEGERKRVDVIEGAALAEYTIAAREKNLLSSLCTLMYLAGFGLIATIIYSQTVAVLRESGLLSLGE